MTNTAVPLDDLVRVDDPAFYLNDPFPTYARLRREAPVYWYEGGQVWVLTKYDDVKYVAKSPEEYSVVRGIFLQDVKTSRNSGGELFGDFGEQIGLTDPPRHRELRRIATPPFTPPAVEKLRKKVEQHVDDLLDRITPGEPVDWVQAVAGPLPIHTACSMLGIPHDNVDQIRYWSDELEKMVAGPMTDEEMDQTVKNFSGMIPYLEDQFENKRQHPDDAMISVLLSAELDNEKLSAANVMMFTQTMIAAGNDTTRSTISGIVALLGEHPEQREKLLTDRSLIPALNEEVMRYVTPARGFTRSVVKDTEMRGVALKAGDWVYLAYDAANRDEEAFSNPEVFDITAPRQNAQVAFGYGTHVCIGAPIVRMELKALVERLIDRFPRWELSGPQVRTPTILRSGWLELPVTFYET